MATSTATEPESVEDPVQTRPQQRRQPPRQRQRRLVGQAAEHHVRHDVELGAHGLGDVGMVVTVAGGPPGRHPSIRLRPSASSSRLPWLRTTGSGGVAVFIWA